MLADAGWSRPIAWCKTAAYLFLDAKVEKVRAGGRVARKWLVIAIFPDDGSLIRLATMLVIEQNDEWLVGRE